MKSSVFMLWKRASKLRSRDLQLHIRRDPAGLDGRDVDSNDLCVRKLFGEITERLVVSIL